MEWIFERLEKWRLERNLDKSQGFKFDLNTQVSFITEEVTEYLRANNDNERIDALCDITVFCINGHFLVSNITRSDIYFLTRNTIKISDIIKETHVLMLDTVRPEYNFKQITRMCFTMIEDMGYNFGQCMDETLKEIESRTGAINPKTGKWEKFKTDEAKAKWYKADYSKCKLKG